MPFRSMGAVVEELGEIERSYGVRTLDTRLQELKVEISLLGTE